MLVSLQAKPNIIPWSPAPMALMASSAEPLLRYSRALSTPWAMSGLWLAMAERTPQVLPSNPFSLLSKPISLTTLRTRSSTLTKAVVVTSPKTMT